MTFGISSLNTIIADKHLIVAFLLHFSVAIATHISLASHMTRYIKPKGMCDTRNEFTRKYVQERLVYKKVWKFRLSHQKRDKGDNTIGWHDMEQ